MLSIVYLKKRSCEDTVAHLKARYVMQTADKKNKEVDNKTFTVVNWMVSIENILFSSFKFSSDSRAYVDILLKLQIVWVEFDFIKSLPSLVQNLKIKYLKIYKINLLKSVDKIFTFLCRSIVHTALFLLDIPAKYTSKCLFKHVNLNF